MVGLGALRREHLFLLSYISFTAHAICLRDVCSMHSYSILVKMHVLYCVCGAFTIPIQSLNLRSMSLGCRHHKLGLTLLEWHAYGTRLCFNRYMDRSKTNATTHGYTSVTRTHAHEWRHLTQTLLNRFHTLTLTSHKKLMHTQ